MESVKKGDRGPAVEDIQRRLLSLDYDLGPTRVDGVFLGATLQAVREFQRASGLDEDGVVGPATWSALVDATFTLGDRLLYLRLPYLHGHDVRTLQRTLNTLGFACGSADGIFGAFTERAVREFQRNIGQRGDGIVGGETVRAIMQLRHIWEGRESDTSVSTVAPARAAGALAGMRVALVWAGVTAGDVADRVRNLALASYPDADISCIEETDPGSDADLTLALMDDVGRDNAGVPTIVAGDDADALAARLVTAIEARPTEGGELVIDLGALEDADEHALQAVAVGLLDGICAGLS